MESDTLPFIEPTPHHTQKRSSISPTVVIFLLGLAIYFAWLDIALYISIQSCNNNNGHTKNTSVSIKNVMQPPSVHYLDIPISQYLELELSLSNVVTPNFISFLGVAFGLLSSWFISYGTRPKVLLGILLYKVRDLMDALDGVIARGVGAAVVPTPGTNGYYVDGWCDVASDTALLLATGYLLNRACSSPHHKMHHQHNKLRRLLTPIFNHQLLVKVFTVISLPIIVLAMQSLLSAICWNWTTTQLYLLLESDNTSSKEKQTQLFQSTSCWLVMYFWRLLNPHSLSQALLVSLLVDRTKQWVEHARVVVSLPLVTLCLASWVWVYILGIKLHVN